MRDEFEGSRRAARRIARRHELRRTAVSLIRRALGRPAAASAPDAKQRYTERQAKAIVLDEGLALTSAGEISWFYTAFERNAADPLTNFALAYIEAHVPKDARILVTGCGTGIMAFHLADHGFSRIEGRDLLEKCIRVANRMKQEFGYAAVSFAVDDCLKPKLDAEYDAITALHWLFSAWMGNYGNAGTDSPKSEAVRLRVLGEFLAAYAAHLARGGLLLFETTDAVADYRDPFDHPLGEKSLDIYPVRHTPEQVARCAGAVGLDVIEKRIATSHAGHQPRTSYILRKR
jgi:hypothetical protein